MISLVTKKETKQFRISQSQLSLFHDCPRCFYLLLVKGLRRPSGFPFLLNSKVDRDVKRHFDQHRQNGTSPVEFIERGYNLRPSNHPKLSEWRNCRRGLQYLHAESGFLITGALDDLFEDEKTGEHHMVDIKATAKRDGVTSAEEIHPAFKRQLDLYSWLGSHNGLAMGASAFLYYCNSRNQPEEFKASLEFDISVIEYPVNLSWIPTALLAARECLNRPFPPPSTGNCDHCRYTEEYTTRILVGEVPILREEQKGLF